MSAQPRGATVAFDSIDGLPPAQFQTLVHNLNDEAQSRQLAVISREGSAAYRVRGYLAVEISKNRTRVTWIWDVFEGEKRALRIEGDEVVKVDIKNGGDPWQAADDALLGRIARSSMDRLATFLTSPEAAPGLAAPAAVAMPDDRSPEAAGIYRIYQAEADPVATIHPPAGGPAPRLPPRRPGAPAIAPGKQASPSLPLSPAV
jgi:hypothetical protein